MKTVVEVQCSPKHQELLNVFQSVLKQIETKYQKWFEQWKSNNPQDYRDTLGHYYHIEIGKNYSGFAIKDKEHPLPKETKIACWKAYNDFVESIQNLENG